MEDGGSNGEVMGVSAKVVPDGVHGRKQMGLGECGTAGEGGLQTDKVSNNLYPISNNLYPI